MEPITVFTTLFGGVVSKICLDIWNRYWNDKQTQFGIAANSQGIQRQIPNISGVLSAPDSGIAYYAEDEFPAILTGNFIGEEYFVEFTEFILEDEDDQVIILVLDEELGDVYFFGFDFDGYAISLMPGTYSLYALIVDPYLDEVLGFGYPLLEHLEDPNPIAVIDDVQVELNFIIFDIDELL